MKFAIPVSGTETETGNHHELRPGSWQTNAYIHLLEGKQVAVAGNHTSMVYNTHLVDTLLSSGIQIVKVFSPEHGFRGQAPDGANVDDSTDPQTGVPIVSLYGNNRRPTREQLADVDVILFDIQDVGTRFYTYISTMTYIMEEAAIEGIPVIILDRPNPNGHYVDGPVLEPEHASFVGLHPVPVVHGMTVGEYALMVNGEGWLKNERKTDLRVIPVAGYSRDVRYSLPVAPSPNLPNMRAVYLYPSLCFFEGTPVSVGRGTDKPFQQFGHPDLPASAYPHRFIPESRSESVNPPQLGEECHGMDLGQQTENSLAKKSRINLEYLLEAYHHYPDKSRFFNPYFEKLTGTTRLREQIEAGYSASAIRASWQDELRAFRQLRAPYLLYPKQN
ncbi:MAG: exo-beta-N-acetylmuramidase NamZ domain-containing protein [Bacteroidales bacterium]